jgi:ribosome biogenesis GTPase
MKHRCEEQLPDPSNYMENTSRKKLGFDGWFEGKIDPAKLIDCHIARVTTVHKESYIITNEKGDVPAEITGKLMFSADSLFDYPTVGDWVYAQFLDNDSFAVIHEILPRKSLLKRKTPGKKVDVQLIAANIDTSFIMQSLDVNYNLRRLERYMVMIHESDIEPVVLLSKSDLLPFNEIEKRVADIHSIMPKLQIVPFSNKDKSGLERVTDLLTPANTFCLLGSSGVGKTTLLNNLIGEALFETQPVREKDGKGKHITARRQLIMLRDGAMVIDTPGMRELGNIAVDAGISDTFDEIAELSQQCRFNDCSHIQEQGCAILAALRDGVISRDRYQNYIKLLRESAHYEMSYLEKRRKAKKFGKFVKSVMKDKKDRG